MAALSAAALASASGTLLFMTIKRICGRERPCAIEPHCWASLLPPDKFSFPSGHSIEAWTLATVIANEYHDHRAVEIAAYGLASAVSISRFTGHNHFLSDVLVGSALGYGIGRYVYKTHHVKTSAFGGEEEEEEQSFNHSRRWPSIAPAYSRSARVYGVALAWSF